MRAGSDPVWEALLANRERALRVALSRCADRQEAEDCTQEALARIAAMPDVDPARVGPLVSTVVANLAVDGHRRRTRTARLVNRLGPDAQPAPPDEDVCDRAEAVWLREQLGALGPADRRVLELRADGLTISQAAAELGLTYKAAENALGRARARLRKVWAATAAALGVLLGRPRGRAEPVLAAAVPAAALVAVVAVVLTPAPNRASPPVEAPARAATPAPAEPAGALAPAPASPAASWSSPPATAVAPPPPPPQPPTASPSASPQEAPREISTSQVRTPLADAGPAGVRQHAPDEPLLDSVLRCLEEGPVLTDETVGCPP